MRFQQYYEPKSLAECLALLGEFEGENELLAGGTDVVPALKDGRLKPKAVISLRLMPEMSSINVLEDSLEIGAMARLCDITETLKGHSDYQIISETTANVSSMQICNVATIGGNACNASPSADAIQGLILLNAQAVIAGEAGERRVPIIEFFTGPGKTVLEPQEVLIKFVAPKPESSFGAFYEKFAIRGNIDISIVGAGATVVLNKDQQVVDAVISLAAVAPTPLRVAKAEQALIGQSITPELIDKVAQIAFDSCTPISDQRATAEYRKEMVKVWTKHALEKAWERAKEN